MMNSPRFSVAVILSLFLLLAGCAPQSAKEPTPIPVKFVVVTMCDIGEDEGDQAGEFQLW